MIEKKINVALVGLRFGGCFAGIYLKHPNVNSLTVMDIDKNQVESICDTFHIKRGNPPVNNRRAYPYSRRYPAAENI